jgi:hypothetical protein
MFLAPRRPLLVDVFLGTLWNVGAAAAISAAWVFRRAARFSATMSTPGGGYGKSQRARKERYENCLGPESGADSLFRLIHFELSKTLNEVTDLLCSCAAAGPVWNRCAALVCSFRIFSRSSSRAFEPAAWAAWNVGKPPPVSFTLNGVRRR